MSSIRVIILVTIAIIALFSAVVAHPQPGVTRMSDEECQTNPAFQSYHIHVLFWASNANSTAAAVNLQKEFARDFNIPDGTVCSFGPSAIEPDADVCVFDIHYSPSGPFLTAQTTYFIPISLYEKAVNWVMHRHRNLDVFVHPNTGCPVEDHVLHSLWGGNKWELDVSKFF